MSTILEKINSSKNSSHSRVVFSLQSIWWSWSGFRKMRKVSSSTLSGQVITSITHLTKVKLKQAWNQPEISQAKPVSRASPASPASPASTTSSVNSTGPHSLNRGLWLFQLLCCDRESIYKEVCESSIAKTIEHFSINEINVICTLHEKTSPENWLIILRVPNKNCQKHVWKRHCHLSNFS